MANQKRAIINATPDRCRSGIDTTSKAPSIFGKKLGPDWKKRQEERRAALNEKIARQ
jgi:hypothetical protein